MLGDVDLLIDFAWSRQGPVAVDAAKLVSDLLLRLPALRPASVPTWATLPNEFRPLRPAFELATGDQKIFTVALCAFLAEALTYATVSADTKDWIQRAIGTVTFW